MSKEEIEKAKGWLSGVDVNSEFEASSKEISLQYIEQLEKENKQLKICYKLMENEAMKDGLEERKKQNKIIELMSEQLEGLVIWNDEKQEPLILMNEEEVIEYFKKKVEDK